MCIRDREYIDVIIPRGGAGLIRRVVEDSSIPVIETGSGVCHTFVDEFADLEMALEIAVNAKVQRPSVCNSMETLLVHQAVAREFLPRLNIALLEYGVRIHGDEAVAQYMENTIPLTEESFSTEYNDICLLYTSGAIIAVLCVGEFYHFITLEVSESLAFFPLVPMFPFFYDVALYILGGGIVVGAIGSTISLKQYMKV